MTSTTQKTIILKRCGPCPDFASLTLAFALQLRKSTEKPGFDLDYLCLPQSVSFYQYCIFIFICILLLLEGQTDEAWDSSKSSAVSEIGGHWIEKDFNIFVASKRLK
jgi:hypothetical protein